MIKALYLLANIKITCTQLKQNNQANLLNTVIKKYAA